jgi:hypothetical protein
MPDSNKVSGPPKMGGGMSSFKFPGLPSTPNRDGRDFQISDFMEEQMNHHKTHHLDENGNCKPHLKEKGMKFMKDFME